jgi:hypothetical protein
MLSDGERKRRDEVTWSTEKGRYLYQSRSPLLTYIETSFTLILLE